MRRPRSGLVLLVSLLWPGVGVAAVPSVYLVQSSGWMEPFFSDPASPFKPLLKALVGASQTGEVVVADFNQDGQVPGRRSPEVVFRGAYDAAAVGAAIDGLSLPQRPGGRLADADFDGALLRTLTEVLRDRPGIVWIATNNKNSRNNSPEINRNTRAFAELVRSSPYLPVVAAYPVRMPVTGKLYTERGLILYAIAYGEEAGAELSRILDGAAMRALFTAPPIRLKHLERAPLVFTPTEVVGSDGVTVAARPGGGLVLGGVPAAGTVVTVPGVLRSEYYPQVIERAELSAGWDGEPAGVAAGVAPGVLAGLPAQGTAAVTLTLTVPPVARTPGGWMGLAGLGAQVRVLDGRVVLRLDRLRMGVGPEFVARLGEVAALDQLPDVFADYQRVEAATASVPVTVAVRFSAWPLVGMLAAAAGLLGVLVGGAWLLARARGYPVTVDGRARRVELRPFQTRRLPLPGGRVLVVTGRVTGAHRVREVKGD